MTRHRPTYVLFLPGRVVATCKCHLGQSVRFDRPLPPAKGRAA